MRCWRTGPRRPSVATGFPFTSGLGCGAHARQCSLATYEGSDARPDFEAPRRRFLRHALAPRTNDSAWQSPGAGETYTAGTSPATVNIDRVRRFRRTGRGDPRRALSMMTVVQLALLLYAVSGGSFVLQPASRSCTEILSRYFMQRKAFTQLRHRYSAGHRPAAKRSRIVNADFTFREVMGIGVLVHD